MRHAPTQPCSVRCGCEHMFVPASETIMDKASLEHLLARGVSVEKIAKRFGKHPSTVSYWMATHGLEAPNRDKHAAKGGIERDRLDVLVDKGMTIAEIAAEVGSSKGTVRHWMRKYGLRTMASQRVQTMRRAKEHGISEIDLVCPIHGQAKFVVEARGYYRCTRCRSRAVSKRRRKVKQILVDEAGGRCWLCGYDRYLGALEFHHLNPEEKRLAISYNGVTQSLVVLREEAAKCVLLCSNCHAEVEGGITALPATVLVGRSPKRH